VTGHIAKKKTDLRVIRSALRDMGGTHVSEGVSESRVAMLHEDVDRVQQDVADLKDRVDALEDRHAARAK
jgi:ubiquinone biosynthesis protein UbiJ